MEQFILKSLGRGDLAVPDDDDDDEPDEGDWGSQSTMSYGRLPG